LGDARQQKVERAMGIESTRAPLPELENTRFRVMPTLTPPDPKGAGDADLASHSDFWAPAEYAPPWSMTDVSPGMFAQLAALLVERGWSIGDVRKVLGENFLRVARAVWK
jgi:hypothetical protein